MRTFKNALASHYRTSSKNEETKCIKITKIQKITLKAQTFNERERGRYDKANGMEYV